MPRSCARNMQEWVGRSIYAFDHCILHALNYYLNSVTSIKKLTSTFVNIISSMYAADNRHLLKALQPSVNDVSKE